MKRRQLVSMLFFLLPFIFMACSDKEEDAPACLEQRVTMQVNGELQTFEVVGYGIDLVPGGHVMQLNLDRRSSDPFREQGIAFELPYKATGKNVIKHLYYHQYMHNTPFDGDFATGTLNSQVITNSKTCFYATFSGQLTIGNQTIEITDGVISYTYETPFDN